MYEGCSESNAYYFIMLGHSVIDRWWWYGSRGQTFQTVFCYILLLCNGWQQKGSQRKWRLTWKQKCRIELHAEKMASIDIHCQ